ncbi:MAG: hypothetical protein KAH11_02235 [Rhodospirillales bacterium]|nr:hypothetical protein [Rhodospirillales bacterium]
MLLEALKYLTTPCPPPFRRMGYLKELIATEARYRRNRATWQPHLDRTRAVIARAVEATQQRRLAVVFGAGMLADIPLDVLAGAFDRVRLVDVCFLRATRRSAARHAHVELLTCDITGVVGPLLAGELPAPDLPPGVSLADADLAVSANVLAQLPLVPLDCLRRTRPDIDDAALERFAQAIIRAHLVLLETCGGTRCLITEVERQVRDGERLIDSVDPLRGVLPDRDGEEWVWDIAPRPELVPDADIRNRVRGLVW